MRSSARSDTVPLMARRLRVPAVDLLLAVAGFVLALAELLIWDEWSTEPKALQVTGVLVICGGLALRRAAPLPATAIAASGAVLLAVGGDPPQLLAAGLAGMLLAYTIAAELDGRELLVAAMILAAGVVLRDIADPALNGFDIAIDGVFFWHRSRSAGSCAGGSDSSSSSAVSLPTSSRTPSGASANGLRVSSTM